MNVPQRLLLATQNQGKLRELRQLLGDLPLKLYDLKDFPDVEGVPETGESFIENASLKAVGYATQTGLLTLADDSELAVDAQGDIHDRIGRRGYRLCAWRSPDNSRC